MVDRLVQSGWLVREHDPDDRRRLVVRLARKAEKALKKIEPFGMARAVEKLKGMNEKDRRRAVERIPDISDLVPPGGEEKALDSIYERWEAGVSDRDLSAVLRFMDRSFVVRDGEKWSAGSPGRVSRMSVEDALERLAPADVVFFGEQHNQAGAHLLEVFLLRLLWERHGGIAVCMEMFERQSQPILDDYLSGKTDEDTFLARMKDPKVKGLWPREFQANTR
jgi:hypothetical protein